MKKQYYRSASLEGLEYQKKYDLDDYTDPSGELVIFGMYREEDFEVLRNHSGPVTIVFQGSDAKNLTNEWAEYIRERNIPCIAISSFIFDTLTNHWLDPKMKYLSATVPTKELANCPNGDFVHFYSSNDSNDSARYLGEHMIPEIIQKTGIPIIQTAFGMYDKPELYGIYRSCFLHLRLTEYDGCPNTNLEMGLMGRKSVFNGKGMPATIPWIDVNHVCDIILSEYDNRNKDNSMISKEVLNFIKQNTL
jgi:hypothetical protein